MNSIVTQLQEFPGHVAQEVYGLYHGHNGGILEEEIRWRNGQSDAAAWDTDKFCFRDNLFMSVEQALDEYARQCKDAEPWDALHRYGVDLHACFPFAAFEGATYVMVCGPHRLQTTEVVPIVSIFHGIDLFFYSLQSMVRTCIAWVQNPHWTKEYHLGLHEDIEMRIWRE